MTKLTDLEICKRIGEIEHKNGEFSVNTYGFFGRRYIDGSFLPYNPLTDDALCFQLMVKYKVDVLFCGKVYAECDSRIYPDELSRADDESTNKAICLAIIEAHTE